VDGNPLHRGHHLQLQDEVCQSPKKGCTNIYR
jgi:hypothetical protein